MGGAVIYWFTGASTQAVVTGAYRAVEFIKRNMKLDGAAKASEADSRKVVAICTQYAQAGMLNIFLVVFFTTLSFACLESYFFIGFLIGLALFGLFQAIFMANAGGAWDNAKKVVETILREKGTKLHEATVVGDTVGDPFKDTSSVAMNPIIKFTTLFGLLAVELAETLRAHDHATLTLLLSVAFGLISMCFVYRSFYGMRIKSGSPADGRAGALTLRWGRRSWCRSRPGMPPRAPRGQERQEELVFLAFSAPWRSWRQSWRAGRGRPCVLADVWSSAPRRSGCPCGATATRGCCAPLAPSKADTRPRGAIARSMAYDPPVPIATEVRPSQPK